MCPASYDPHQDFEELKGEEAQCDNCYHEEDFPERALASSPLSPFF